MKKILLSAVAVAALMSACKKDDKKDSSASKYSINGTNYNATVAVNSGIFVATSGSSATSVTASFMSLPTADGNYTVTSGATSATEVGVAVAANNNAYLPSSSTSVSAAVTVTGGKVKIVIPEFWAVNFLDDNDSIKVSATLVQP